MSRRFSRSLCAAAVAIGSVVFMAPAAQAQSASAEAEQLFRDGKKLMKEGNYVEACAAFDASQRKEPSVATLLSLADCREKNGQIASAWAGFLDAERQTRGGGTDSGLNKTAKDRAAKLEPRLSFLTVSVPDEARIDGLELTRNGEKIENGAWNRAIPVDGGEYTVTGKAPGHEAWSTTVNVANENGSVSVDVPKFKEVEVLTTPEGETGEDRAGGPDPDVGIETERRSAITGRRKIALGVAALGVLSAAGGIVLGVQANGLRADAADLCPTMSCDDAEAANALIARSDSRALFANVSFGVAAAAVITAGVLWFTGSPSEPAHASIVPSLTPSQTGVAFAVTGRF